MTYLLYTSTLANPCSTSNAIFLKPYIFFKNFLISMDSHFNSKKPGSQHLPSISPIVQFQYTCITISEPLTYIPTGKNLIN